MDRLFLQEVLATALRRGGTFAEIFVEDRENALISLRGGKIENAARSRICGAGVRVFDGLKCIYCYTAGTNRAELLACAERAAAAVMDTRAQGCGVRLTERIPANLHRIAQLPGTVESARKAQKVRDAYAAAKAYSPEIAQAIVDYTDGDQRVTIANSEGLCVSDRRVYTRLRCSAVASSGVENQSGTLAPGAMMGFELFDARVDPEAVGREAARTAVTMLHAPACPAGVMPVVIDSGFGGVIFHEACGHSLEATSVARDMSEFCGKLGRQIAAACVTAVDDGTIPGEWGSTNVDDEGMETGRLVLIENGILKNYMIDRLNGLRMGMAPTGSGRRQSYAYAPTSRMRNTYIAAGTDDEAQMIATMGDGLYARRMGGGSVNPATGEFNFAVDEGYLVKDGKIAHPVRGASLIGRGGEVLMRIDRVGRELRMEQGMCGSLSGSVPVNVGQPMIRVSSITVGGSGK